RRGQRHGCRLSSQLQQPRVVGVPDETAYRVLTIDGYAIVLPVNLLQELTTVRIPLERHRSPGGEVAPRATFRSKYGVRIGHHAGGQPVVVRYRSCDLVPLLKKRLHRGVHEKHGDDLAWDLVDHTLVRRRQQSPIGLVRHSIGEPWKRWGAGPLGADQLVVLKHRA